MARLTNEERFWSYVERRGRDECWPWLRYRRHGGHGVFYADGQQIIASRYVYELTQGPLGDKWALHTCDNGWCCNPSHIYAGTYLDNIRDRESRGRNVNPKGENHGAALLTWDQVRAIRSRLTAGEPSTVLASEYGVTYWTVRKIATGETWKEGSDARA